VKASTRSYTIDANIILRYLIRDHEAHWQKACAIVRAVDAGAITVVCDPITLGEIVFTLGSLYKLERKQVCGLLAPLLKAEGFDIADKDIYIQAIELYGDSVPHFGDACACARAIESSEGRLFSFDKKLSSVPGVERVEEL
jgi:predicted nucleic-acid-binding protein